MPLPPPATGRRPQAPKKPRLIVHFGIHKTGTSSIQASLRDNDGPKNGYALVGLGAGNASAVLQNSFPAAPEDGPEDGAAEARALRAQEARRRLRRAILAARDAAPGRPIILSGEAISGFSAAQTAEMVAFFADLPVRPDYIGYLREPASYIRSSLQQVLKARMPPASLLAEARTGAPELSARDIVLHLDALVGRAQVTALAFDRAHFPQGDVVRDFATRIGLDPAGLAITRVNESLPLLAVKLLYAYRAFGPDRERGAAGTRTRKAFIDALGPITDRPFAFHPDLCAAITAASAPLLHWAQERLDRPLPPAEGDPAGIRRAEDLLQFSAADLAQFAALGRRFGIDPAGLSDDPDRIAARMDRIRLHFLGGSAGAAVDKPAAPP